MSKKFLYTLLIVLSGFMSSQQNEEFKSVKEHFDYQRYLLANEFRKENGSTSAANRKALNATFSEFMVKLDSIQNSAYVGALIRVKNREDLSRLNSAPFDKSSISSSEPEIKEAEEAVVPVYPGGINALRNQVANLFYYDATTEGKVTLRTTVTFVVDRNGSVSNVFADGENQGFNRQAMIAVYLLPEKFAPARLNGVPVRYRFALPLTMNFE